MGPVAQFLETTLDPTSPCSQREVSCSALSTSLETLELCSSISLTGNLPLPPSLRVQQGVTSLEEFAGSPSLSPSQPLSDSPPLPSCFPLPRAKQVRALSHQLLQLTCSDKLVLPSSSRCFSWQSYPQVLQSRLLYRRLLPTIFTASTSTQK